MEAFTVQVTEADSSRLEYHAWVSYEKHELFISPSGRMVNMFSAANLDSLELATQFRDAIIARQFKVGHRDFKAEVQMVRSTHKGFAESIVVASKTVREKLIAWGCPKPEDITIDQGHWIIRAQHPDNPSALYLVTLGKNGSAKFSTRQDLAKRYKQEHFVRRRWQN